MCLMLYLATSDDQPLRSSPELSVEQVETPRESVRQWFSLPTVRFIGAHTGCSCGFPHVIAEEPIEYWDGMFDGQDREADLKSVDSLLALVREHVTATGEVQLYPVWDGEEGTPPKGVINLGVGALNRETFFFNEQFFYRVTAAPEEAHSSPFT
jgi:hypothetical protein